MIEYKDAILQTPDTANHAPLTLHVEAGEMVGLRVPQSAWATQMLLSMLGMAPLAEGYASVDGEPVLPATARLFRRRMAYVPVDLDMPFARVADMAKSLFLLDAHGDVAFRKSQLMEAWRALDIDPSYYDSSLQDVSRPVVQRMLVATCSLLQRPILLLDHPTSRQDAQQADRVGVFLRRPPLDETTRLIATDDEQLLARCDRVVALTDA